jgi:hypothetical protein
MSWLLRRPWQHWWCKHQKSQLQERKWKFFESGSPFSEPACIFTDRREASQGEKSTVFFRKTREMTSILTFPCRQPRLSRAGAHRNGLWDVKETRTSPLHLPENRSLALLIPDFLCYGKIRYFAETFGMIPTSSARNTDFVVFCRKKDLRHDFKASRSSNAAKKTRNVLRIK